MEDYRLTQSGQEVQDILNGAAMQVDLTAETERATEAEQTLQGNIDAEETRAQGAEDTLQDNIDAEETRAKAAEKQNADDIDAIEEKIPSGASSSNKLATEEYVNDSVATATATFRGTYNVVTDLNLLPSATHSQISASLKTEIATADSNDYAFVLIPTSVETPEEIEKIERYKYNGSVWGFEYVLNNSGFTAAQWAAINSGITSGDVSKLAALPTNDQLTTLLAGKQDTLTFDNVPTPGSSNPVKSGGVYSAIKSEETRAMEAESQVSSAIEAILLLIPSAASALNQLADKAFVNSSIATATATFRGTYNLVTDLSLNVNATHSQIAGALGINISTADNNDYAFVQIPTSLETPTEIRVTERYKFNGTSWAFEYDLNNSGFTAAQWAAINSGITIALVGKLNGLPTNAELTTLLNGKQDTLTFDNVPTQGSTNPVKSSGIYNVIKAITDLVPAEATAQNQLADKADVAAKIVAAIPSWKGQYDALTDLQAVTGAKAGDMGCVKTTDSDGHAVLTFYQYSAQGAWVVYYTLRHYAQNKPATTGTMGDYPYNGMGRIELQKNIVNGVNTLTQAMLTQQNTIYVIQYDFTLGEDITIPVDCILEFDGGSISASGSNDTITGTNTRINEDALYNIFNDCTIKGFELSKIDVRWVGANQSNNDNATYFQRVFSNIVKYHRGTPVYVVGKYKITSTVTIESDFNLKGFHNNTRFSLHSTEDDINYSCSEIIVNCGNSDTPAFDIIGEFASETASFCDLNISNIKFTGVDNTKDVCIRYSASGSPSRPCVIEKCEAHGFLYFIEVKATNQSVIGNLTIKENNIYENGKAIYSYSDGDYMGMCNLSIKDNVIEHNGENCIYLSNLFGSIIINNNILEGEDNPIYIKPYVQHSSNRTGANIEIANNYFERASDSDTKIFIDAADPVLNKQFYGADVRILNNFSAFGFKINIKWCRITALDRIDCPPIFDTKYSIFENCIFEKDVNAEGLYIEQLIGCNFFESYPESNYNDKGGKIGTIGNIPISFADCKGKNNCIVSDVCNNVQITSDNIDILLIGKILTTRGDEYNNILIRNQYNSNNITDKSFYLKYSSPYYFVYKFTKQDVSISAPYNLRSSVSNGTAVGVDSSNFVYYEAPVGKVVNYPLVVQTPGSSLWNGEIWLTPDGYPADARRKGTTAQRPTSTISGGTLRQTIDNGFVYYDTDLKKHIYVASIQNNGEVNWAEDDGAVAGVKRSGTFSQKPADWAIYVGFVYFCTDKQTTEGVTDGIEIIHKGNNVWVDALGRVVS